MINPIPKNYKETNILSFVTTYNPKNLKIIPVVRKLNKILKPEEEMCPFQIQIHKQQTPTKESTKNALSIQIQKIDQFRKKM